MRISLHIMLTYCMTDAIVVNYGCYLVLIILETSSFLLTHITVSTLIQSGSTSIHPNLLHH